MVRVRVRRGKGAKKIPLTRRGVSFRPYGVPLYPYPYTFGVLPYLIEGNSYSYPLHRKRLKGKRSIPSLPYLNLEVRRGSTGAKEYPFAPTGSLFTIFQFRGKKGRVKRGNPLLLKEYSLFTPYQKKKIRGKSG